MGKMWFQNFLSDTRKCANSKKFVYCDRLNSTNFPGTIQQKVAIFKRKRMNTPKKQQEYCDRLNSTNIPGTAALGKNWLWILWSAQPYQFSGHNNTQNRQNQREKSENRVQKCYGILFQKMSNQGYIKMSSPRKLI